MTAGQLALKGEMGSVSVAGRNVSNLDGLNIAMSWIRAGIERIEVAGEAQALTRLIATCAPVERHAQSIAAARLQAGQALEQYSREVTSLQQEVRQLEVRKRAAEARLSTQKIRLAELDMESPEAGNQSRKLTSLVADSNADLRLIERSLSDSDTARISLDSRCADTLATCTSTITQLSTNIAHGNGGASSPFGMLLMGGYASKNSVLPDGLSSILDGKMSPEEAATAWAKLGLTEKDVQNLPIEAQFRLANTEGVPAWARDISSRQAVKYAIASPENAYQLMGFSESDLSLKDFTSQVEALNAARQDAERKAKLMPGKPIVQLVGFGNHDGAITSSISLGDLDKASNVGVNVSGMNSSVSGMSNGVQGAEQLFRAAYAADMNSSYAVVTWIGYHSPGLTEVRSMDRADSGAVELASFLDGLNAVRAGNPIQQFGVFAHSYGSTTAVEALKLTNSDIDSLVTYGSAGVKNETSVDQLNAGTVFATSADGDGVAWAGYRGGNRTDPRDIDNVIEFSAEDVNDLERVTVHDMFTEDSPTGWFNWGGKVGYLSAGSSSLDSMGWILATGGVK